MRIFSGNTPNGDIINLKISRNKHIHDIKAEQNKGDEITESFKNLFTKAIGNVNELELKSTDLTNQMIVDPDSVNIHDVQIAAEQAELSVMFTKGIVDRVIRAYKEIVSVR